MNELVLPRAHAAKRTATAALCTVLAVAGLFGLAVRFAGDSTRLFWSDETVTALRVSGHTRAQFTAAVIDGKMHAVCIAACALFWNFTGAALRTRILTCAAVVVPAVVLFALDVVQESHRSAVTSYEMPLRTNSR